MYAHALAFSVALKDLEVLLRRDPSELQPLHMRIGEWQTVRTKLLPLLQEAPRLDAQILAEDPTAAADVGYRCLKVLVRLTLPLPQLLEHKLERLRHLQESKGWLLEKDALVTLMYLLAEPLAVVQAERDHDQRNMVELGLTLVRNLLAVPDPVAAATEHGRMLHDRCIMKMHEELVLGQQHRNAERQSECTTTRQHANKPV